MKRLLLVSMVLFLGLAVVSCSCKKRGSAEVQKKEIGPGDKAPNFTLNDMEGNEVSLKSFKGKVVLLDFWATWCTPCKVEIPVFMDLYEQYYSKGFEVVGVALDKTGAKAVKKFEKDEEIVLNYTVLIGDQSVAQLFGGIRAIPTTFMIDKKGVVHSKHIGVPRDMGVFEEAVKELLSR